MSNQVAKTPPPRISEVCLANGTPAPSELARAYESRYGDGARDQLLQDQRSVAAALALLEIRMSGLLSLPAPEGDLDAQWAKLLDLKVSLDVAETKLSWDWKRQILAWLVPRLAR